MAHDPCRIDSSRRRVLLVGFSPLILRGLESHIRAVADVACVAFPSREFDRAVDTFEPDVVIVDTTYLDQAVMRPLMSRRLRAQCALVAYVSDRRGLVDDLASGQSRELADASITTLVCLASGSPLTLVAER